MKDNTIPEIIKLPLYNADGRMEDEKYELHSDLLGGKIFSDSLSQAVVSYEANRRAGTAKTKTRRETAYSGSKPWPQKGTGRARSGSRGSPVWVGGGVAHGPKVRDYSKKLNKKMKKRALASALLGKAADGEIKLIETIELRDNKTREVAELLKKLEISRTFLIVIPTHDPVLWRCVRNIRGSSMHTAPELNAYEVLKPRDVVFVREAFERALKALSEVAVGSAESMEAE